MNNKNQTKESIVLMLPGIGDSDSSHWQSQWQVTNPDFVRVQQRDWDNPVCEEWVNELEQAVLLVRNVDVVLVAHSLGCLLAAHWAAKTKLTNVKCGFFVAPPNPAGNSFPQEAASFSPLPTQRLPFQSIVVASSDDPYGNEDFTKSCAEIWGSQYFNVGPAGHINSSSGFGEWPDGLALLRQLAGLI